MPPDKAETRVYRAVYEDEKAENTLREAVRAVCVGKKIVVITGEGVSAIARASTREAKGVGKTPQAADSYSRKGKPVRVPWLAGPYRQRGRLLRYYTEEVDGIEHQTKNLAPAVSPKKNTPPDQWPLTVQLHGSIRHAVCNTCYHIPTASNSANDFWSECENGECSGGGRLIPNIQFYNTDPLSWPLRHYHEEVIHYDVHVEYPDVLIVVGTHLQSKTSKHLITEFARNVQRKEGACIWLDGGTMEPDTHDEVMSEFTAVIKTGADAFARVVMDYMDWCERRDMKSSMEVNG
ncbi:hypothetical protein DM02DRAFT_700240 [Periconia macrospinosa]|uniref:Deacetylase sirtuin-type domain-containing protein n=1 Tax=Periconia macrospinosa TaxID=97972 RepID=A0A2V1D550_9PLEO|nr:hypothetical protein DM02DRAFT_700240 [Periconia macrospinosa]